MSFGNRMQVLGYFARVSLQAIRRVLAMTPDALDELLGPSEREARKRCVTLKRRTEFVGGRLAAKLAFMAAKKEHMRACTSFCLLDIPPADGRGPKIYYLGARVGNVSISHSGRWAAGLFYCLGAASIDIEDSVWNSKANEHFFSEFELPYIVSEKDARIRWTLKECCLKLANLPSFEFHSAITICNGAKKWVAVTGHPDALQDALLAVFEWGTLVASIGLLPSHTMLGTRLAGLGPAIKQGDPCISLL